jgi:GNAT acetyltransferase-like protein
MSWRLSGGEVSSALAGLEGLQDKGTTRKLRTTWFTGWNPVLDEALAELPEMPTCPHDLYRELSENQSSVPKRLALVTDRGQPVCVVCLRRRDHHWRLVTDGGVAPRSMAPARPDSLYPALASLGVDLWLSSIVEKPPAAWTRSLTSHPFYRISLSTDYERYWRESGHRETLRRARSQLREGFSFEVDQPGAAEWTIEGWKQKWGDSASSEASSASDRVVAARYFQKRGRFHSVRLLRNGEPIAGHSALVLGDNGLLILSTHRLPEFRSAGTRLYELLFHWAAEAGFDNIDLGTGDAYKMRWAPEAGVRWSFNIAPWHLSAVKRLVGARRPLIRAIASRVRA